MKEKYMNSEEIKISEQGVLVTPDSISGGRRPAAIICPGGAYEMVSMPNEGLPVQKFLADNGYAAFILKYSVSPATYPLPQMDLLKSCQYIKDHAVEYGADPDRIVFGGFSAGGHLAASAAGLADSLMPGTKPQGLFLGYPVISLKDSITNEATRENLLNGTDPSERDHLINMLSVENMVNEDFPPTYAFHCSDDESVTSENTSILADALDIHGVKHLCEIFPSGGHAIGLGIGTSAEPWGERMLDFFSMTL